LQGDNGVSSEVKTPGSRMANRSKVDMENDTTFGRRQNSSALFWHNTQGGVARHLQ
jgi:hypothetical protein